MNKSFAALLLTCATSSSAIAAGSITEAITSGEANIDLRLRYENVDQNNAVDDADALTLRTRLGYTTGSFNGFSAKIEVEDVSVIGGVDDYTVGPTGFNPGEYSVIADPESTEVDQAYLKYTNEYVTAKLGRQVITHDGHRFIGHVGWRQDRQTFDALTVSGKLVNDVKLKYGYISKRNRIFAEEADIQSKDHLLNASYVTPIGKLTGYAYLLEVDNDTNNSLDTYGVSFKGTKKLDKMKFLYHLEYADQKNETSATKFDAEYTFIEGGISAAGLTAKVGYEVLGSDNSAYGFSTPLATLHKFNGWADQFLATPAQGLVDTYASLSGKAFKGKWAIVYHDYEADDSTATVDDLGDEINLLYAKKFSKNYSGGIKYASYDSGDAAAGKVDTDKLWIWASASF